MKQHFSRRILSLLLAFVLLVSSCPVTRAAEAETVTEPVAVVTEPVEETEAPAETEATEAAEAPEETEATEATAAPEETEATVIPEETEATEATEAPEETEATEATEATEPAEETEGTEATEPVEETEPVELPYGLKGMPEGYVLSELELEKKAAMLENDVLEALQEMVPGENYAADEILVTTDSEETAAVMAEAFSGDLLRYNDGIAVIRLLTATVYQAVEASLDMALPLPAATPNYIINIEPIVSDSGAALNSELPKREDWSSWVQENMTNPDPLLLYPNDDEYQWMHDAVDTYAAWGVTTGESWVKVAVIDTGVYANHPDLKGRVTEYDVGCGTGDGYGHGTSVAGIIAAAMDNGVCGAGIAPGVSIQSYRIADSNGNLYLEQELRALRNAVSNGAHVINMSFSGAFYVWDVQYEIHRAVDNGVTVVASMGNTGSNTMQYPAAYDGVIAVAATDQNNKRTYYSSYGAWADLCAPGTDIYTTSNDGSYDWFGGTSAAAPMVAGVAALYTSAYGKRVDPATMEKVLKAAATKVSETGMGKGLVNAANMLDEKPEAPYVLITDGETIYDASKPVPSDAVAYFFDSESAAMGGHYENMDGVFVYTINGKNPSVKNGEVVNGEVIEEPAALNLAKILKFGSKVTLKIAHVSGMGMVGKIRTLKLTITGTNDVDGVTVHGSAEVVAGKSSTYTAEVSPITARQDVTWKITYRSNAGMEGVKISNTGKLTTPKNQSGYVLIQATSVADPSYKSEAFRVNIKHFEPVSKLELIAVKTGVKATTGYSYVGHDLILEARMYAKQSGSSQLVRVQREVRWSSSNNWVAYVESDGRVYALSKGTATITCTVLDGSGKSAKCKITVRQPVEEVTVTGQLSIAPGASATYKAAVKPSSAYIKKVDWSLKNAPSGVTINASGKVTVASNVRLGSSFYVVATSKDEDRASTSYKVTVSKKCTSVNVVAGSTPGIAPGVTNTGSSYVKSVGLFSVDLPDTSGKDNYIDLNQKTAGNSSALVEWSSSKPAIASVDESGRVTAHKAGTTNITVKASDGSGKKATVKITVTNPVSSMSIKSNAPQMTMSVPYIGFGKSVKNTVTFADTYGVPSKKKVNWDFVVVEVDSDGDIIHDYTRTFKNLKLVSLNKNGTLSVKKGMESYWYEMGGDLAIMVYANATDGTGVSASIMYFAIPLTKSMYMDPADKSGTIRSDKTGYAQFYCDQWNVLWDDWNYAFTATSSNPKVAGVLNIYPLNDDGWYEIEFATGKYGTTGTAKITIKAADGSNKSCSFTLKVVP